MIHYDFGDVILVPFPFTDQTTSKKRPAVVVSSKAYHQDHPDLILMAITSQHKHRDIFGEITVIHWEKAGLLKPSVVKPIFATIEKSLVVKKLGRLQKQDRKLLQSAMQKILGE